MIPISSDISIKEREIHFDFVRASGPGGQNVNKVSSAVQLRFDVLGSPSLPGPVRDRLISLAGKRVSEEGILIIKAARHRSQHQNRQDAMERLIMLIKEASKEPEKRIKTTPSAASKKRTRKVKQHRSRIKQMRKPVPVEDE